MYSIGNEIPEIGTPHGAGVGRELCRKIKALDQIVADIAGYNYMTARYEPDGEKYPNRIIVGSETYTPEIARNWELVKKLDHVIGDFTWTGWDYIGEAGVGVPAYQWGKGGFGAKYPCQLAYVGDIDITGFRRPVSYYREAVFGLRETPYIAVQKPERYGQHLIKTPWVLSDTISSWTFNGFEGKPVIVEVYAGGDEVELFLNDSSLSRKTSGNSAGYRTLFEITYEAGTLKAISYLKDGSLLGEMELRTLQEEQVIRLMPEETLPGAVPFDLTKLPYPDYERIYVGEGDTIDLGNRMLFCGDDMESAQVNLFDNSAAFRSLRVIWMNISSWSMPSMRERLS